MRLNASFGLALSSAVLAGAVWGCGNGRSQLLPASPSALSSSLPPSPQAAGANPTVQRQRLDEDGDGYEDPVPGDTPGGPPPGSMPDPGQVPPPEAGIPVQLTVNITGSFGSTAFAPNPLQAAIGNTIVWVNGDLIAHNIVLDDGTPVGNLAPGQSSPPVLLNTAVAGYRCTFHPSMTGQVTTVPPGAGVPPDPSQVPLPGPVPGPAPSDPYDEGYDDDYYLKAGS